MRPFPPVLAAIVVLSTAVAQGTYVNYEDPQGKPIAIATVGQPGNTHSYVLVCNTPDDRVEIYRAELPLGAALWRVPVGLSPVTVRWHAAENRLYTCNSLGDSVSVVRLDLQNSDPSQIVPVIERTVQVGDEPCDIAFASDGLSCHVALAGRGKVSHRTLPQLLELSNETVTGSVHLRAPSQGAPHTITDAIKVPRSILVLGNDRVVLNGQDGNGASPAQIPDDDYDFAMHWKRPSGDVHVAGLGTTHFAMAAHAASNRLFVVGQAAQNNAAMTEQLLSGLPGGFVQSWLWALEINPNTTPVQLAEATPGAPSTQSMPSIHLNRDYAVSGPAVVPVGKPLALAQPTDLALVEDANTVHSIVVPAFGSDRVAILTPSATAPGGWSIQRIDMPLAAPGGSYARSGPRGVAWSPSTIDPSAPPNTPAGVVFVANRLDNSLAAINPWTASLIGQRALANDPTPAVVRAGREFLYGAHLSGSGFVSCASCHIDGRTDGLGWNLSEPGSSALVPKPATMLDHPSEGVTLLASLHAFDGDKGVKVTQTLQGLVNSLVEPLEIQDRFSNRPYHWRGDRESFESFNPAFVDLLDLSPLPGSGMSPNGKPNGIPDAMMTAFRAFIDTIHHPPNPEQPIHRTYVDSGTANAASGLRRFHEAPLAATGQQRSCVHCHSLPEGSSNTFTLQIASQQGESAALRNLFLREARVVTDFTAVTQDADWIRSNSFGLTHEGDGANKNDRSINDFIRSFHNDLGDSTTNPTLWRRQIVAFVRQFDTGSAPIIGLTRTLDGTAGDDPWLQAAEFQVAEGNAGLAVRVHTGPTWEGYWFDLTTTQPMYRLEGNNTLKQRADILAMTALPNVTVVAYATPARSERRFASQSGSPTPITGPKPGGIRLLPMAPNTAFVDVPTFTGNVEPDFSGFDHVPPSLRSMQYLNAQLAPLGFGVPTVPTHQPPRRFRVTGTGILPGARLEIAMRKTLNTTPVTVTTITATFDLVPTIHQTAIGQQIWETLEELDPLQTMAWLAGGYWAEGVQEVLDGVTPPTVPLAPALRNSYRVRVVNEDGQVSRTTTAALTIADTR